MEALKYKIIKDREQYDLYCNVLESLTDIECPDANTEDEIDLITLLIEKYDDEHNTFQEVDPIKLLRSFMEDHDLSATSLSNLLEVSKGYVSDILNYKKGLSKEIIRKLAEHFKVRQEAFNRPYPLKSAINETLMNVG